jgi:hypothetical protein
MHWIPGAVMKRLSSLLTVLLLGAVPLTAAALDYGPNRTLLAVENSVPQLPDTQVRATSPEPAAPESDPAAPLPVASRTTPGSSPAALRRTARQAAHGKAQPTTSKPDPATTPSQFSWQSLLPGSIQ